MSIQSQINRLKSAITSAFDICQSKGATMPSNKTVENLYNCINSISTGIDTSDATAGVYDIYNGKIAYANGEKITGAYRVVGRTGGDQISSGSTNCSSSQLVIPCNFEPTHVCIVLNAGTYSTNTVIAAMCQNGAVTYHSRTSSGVARNQYTSSTENYFSYDSTNKRVTIKRPTTSYNWSSQNYRYFCFK